MRDRYARPGKSVSGEGLCNISAATLSGLVCFVAGADVFDVAGSLGRSAEEKGAQQKCSALVTYEENVTVSCLSADQQREPVGRGAYLPLCHRNR